MTKKTPTKKARSRLAAMADEFLKLACKTEGPAREHLRAAIRSAFDTTGGVHGREMTMLQGALHCINLAHIHLDKREATDADGSRWGRTAMRDIADVREPESVLVSLATAAADLEELMDAVAAEIEAAKPLLARKAA